jgi:hypothetical protein
MCVLRTARTVLFFLFFLGQIQIVYRQSLFLPSHVFRMGQLLPNTNFVFIKKFLWRLQFQAKTKH